MALIWADGFDTYGNSQTFLAQRGYAVATVSVENNVSLSRTGPGSVFSSGGTGVQILQRIATNPLNVCCQGAAFFTATAPTNGIDSPGFLFRIGATNNVVRVVLNSTLGISAVLNGVIVGSSAANVWTFSNWFYLEARVVTGTGTATIEVRINGVLVLLVTGLTIGQITGFGFGRVSNAAGPLVRYDDWVVTDETGTINNSFLGDRRCNTSFVNSDTALAQWVPSTGTQGFAILDNSPPVDTEFVQANNVGDISEFGIQPIGINTNDIAGVVIIGRAAKVDAGTATFRVGINSAGTVNNGPAEAPNVTPSFSYFGHIVERNPNGNIPWTRTTVNAALPRITRDS